MTTRARGSSFADAFERRAQRAIELARSHSASREPLEFAAGLMRAQAAVVRALEAAHTSERTSDRWCGRFAEDAQPLAAIVRPIAAFAASHAPSALAGEAAGRARESDDVARTRLELYWTGDRTAADDYLSRAMLRPYVEWLRERGVPPVCVDRAERPRGDSIQRGDGISNASRSPGRCPYCGGAAPIALRRSAADDEGAARSLVCSLCALEWSFQRILCPACGERSPAHLPSFASEAHASVRIEACETCRRYVKSMLVTDARTVPEIDDLASIALDLWAIEQGFARVEPGLAGV